MEAGHGRKPDSTSFVRAFDRINQILEPLSGLITLAVMCSSVGAKKPKQKEKSVQKQNRTFKMELSTLRQHCASSDAGKFYTRFENPARYPIKKSHPPPVTRSTHGKISAGTGKNSDGIG